ncbi:unnamed protein product [Durusdinium trenchii]|uniref:Uncharacterized protein n=1 Tax=Durusdinium trenchii TaxID=1381693 RepID=A0ABP0K3Y1_9DINO
MSRFCTSQELNIHPKTDRSGRKKSTPEAMQGQKPPCRRCSVPRNSGNVFLRVRELLLPFGKACPVASSVVFRILPGPPKACCLFGQLSTPYGSWYRPSSYLSETDPVEIFSVKACPKPTRRVTVGPGVLLHTCQVSWHSRSICSHNLQHLTKVTDDASLSSSASVGSHRINSFIWSLTGWKLLLPHLAASRRSHELGLPGDTSWSPPLHARIRASLQLLQQPESQLANTWDLCQLLPKSSSKCRKRCSTKRTKKKHSLDPLPSARRRHARSSQAGSHRPHG